MKLADKILILRKQQGLSQEALAEQMDISRQTISRWEMGTAQPDASNILQLSKLFGVTADYLLNDDYESDQDVPIVKNTEKTVQTKVRKLVGTFIAVIGLMGNFIIYIFSRMIEVRVPVVRYDADGVKWYTWGEFIDHSYKYFVQEYDLELLTVLLWMIVIAGLAFVLADKVKVWLSNRRTKRG